MRDLDCKERALRASNEEALAEDVLQHWELLYCRDTRDFALTAAFS
jgi:hypothetical protein